MSNTGSTEDVSGDSFKLYYSTKEVAKMFGLNNSALRFWEKEFPELKPKRGGRGIRQYTADDIETVKLIIHLVKEKGMTISGARQNMKFDKDGNLNKVDILDSLKRVRAELVAMRDALNSFTYNQVDSLKEDMKTVDEE